MRSRRPTRPPNGRSRRPGRGRQVSAMTPGGSVWAQVRPRPRSPHSIFTVWAIEAARDSAVGAVRHTLGPASTPRADYCFDRGASTKAASTRCALARLWRAAGASPNVSRDPHWGTRRQVMPVRLSDQRVSRMRSSSAGLRAPAGCLVPSRISTTANDVACAYFHRVLRQRLRATR
jgi:hypothetical protein